MFLILTPPAWLPDAPFKRPPQWWRNRRIRARRYASSSTEVPASTGSANASMCASHVEDNIQPTHAQQHISQPQAHPLHQSHSTQVCHLPSHSPCQDTNTWHPPQVLPRVPTDMLADHKVDYQKLRTLRPEAFEAGLVKCPDRAFVNSCR